LRRTVRSAAALGGLLALILLPGVVSANDITDVRVDCDGGAILISGRSFPADVTVTVSGPKGYVQTFVADEDVAWAVSLPLGPSGSYAIDWPGSGDGPVTFSVDCEKESQPPGTASPTPSQPPETASPSPTTSPPPSQPPASASPSPSGPPATPSQPPGSPSPRPTRTPSQPSSTPRHTLPPTDTLTPTTAVAATDTVTATLLFISVFALAVALRRTAERRIRRR
jgi:hypothetical protein